MTNWKETVDVSDLFIEYEQGRMTSKGVAQATYERLMQTNCAKDDAFKNLIAKLPNVTRHTQYDKIMNAVFDYGDVNARLFIKTF